MRRFGAAATSPGVNVAATPLFYLSNTAATAPLYVVEIMVSISTPPTTAPIWSLRRTTARGTPTSSVAGVGFDPQLTVASLAALDVVNGSLLPTLSGSRMSAGALNITAGGVFVFTFYDAPIVIPPTNGAGLAIVDENASGATLGAFWGSFRWDE